jgi:hypothetical protein
MVFDMNLLRDLFAASRVGHGIKPKGARFS